MGRFTVLSSLQRGLLSRLELAPDLSARSLARQLRARPSTIAYNLALLRERGIIRRTVVVNPFALGLSYVALFFSARFRGANRRERFVQTLSRHPKITWLGALAGEFQFGLTALVHDLFELQEALDLILESSGADITEKLVAPRLSFSFQARPWESSQLTRRQTLEVTRTPVKRIETIDELDHSLLEHLGRNAELSGRELARAIGAPVSTTERRLKSLRERNIITGFRFSIDGEKLGLSSYRILLTLPGMSSRDREKIQAFARASAEVAMVIQSFGAWDVELLVEVEHSAALRSFLERLMDSIGITFQRVTVLNELTDLKFSAWPSGVAGPAAVWQHP